LISASAAVFAKTARGALRASAPPNSLAHHNCKISGSATASHDSQLFDEKICFFGLSALCRCNHPTRHPAPSGPCVSSFVAILDGHFSTPALAITLSSEELMNVEPVLFGDTHDLFTNCSPL